MGDSALTRTFIAIRFSDEVNGQLQNMQKRLRAADRAGAVKWVEPGLLHLTLQFLGDTDTERLRRLPEALAAQLSLFSAFEAEVRGVGAFPSPTRPEVLWAGVGRGAEELARLAEMVQRCNRQLGFVPESRPFRPHVTLGRVKRPGPMGEMKKALEELAGFWAGKCQMGVVEIVASQLGPRGPSYRTLDALCLKGYHTEHLNRPWEAR